MTLVGGMPAPGKTDWAGLVAELRANPNEAILFEDFKNTPRLRSLMTTINQRLTPALRELPGRVTAHMRGSYRDDQGKLRGDLWVVWHTEDGRPVTGQIGEQHE